MSSYESTEALIRLAKEIRRGHKTKAQVEKELDRIESTFDTPFHVTSFSRKAPPWEQEYLDELADGTTYGQLSREYFQFMAEVADGVYGQSIWRRWLRKVRSKLEKTDWIRTGIVLLAVVALFLLAPKIIAAIRWLFDRIFRR